MIRVIDYIKKYRGKTFYCVYKLIDANDIVVYVGSTKFPSQRIGAHQSSDKDFTYVEHVECTQCTFSELEAATIIKYKPRLNIGIPANNLITTTKIALDGIRSDLESLINGLPIVFERSKNQYIKTDDYKTLIFDMKESAIKSLKKIHEKQDITAEAIEALYKREIKK